MPLLMTASLLAKSCAKASSPRGAKVLTTSGGISNKALLIKLQESTLEFKFTQILEKIISFQEPIKCVESK